MRPLGQRIVPRAATMFFFLAELGILCGSDANNVHDEGPAEYELVIFGGWGRADHMERKIVVPPHRWCAIDITCLDDYCASNRARYRQRLYPFRVMPTARLTTRHFLRNYKLIHSAIVHVPRCPVQLHINLRFVARFGLNFDMMRSQKPYLASVWDTNNRRLWK
ncbi:hypothetical protein BGW80DRAFT_259911 [Lactifluus volemus]|nr:hypothetical protein BGW80DRAFT_259911 [Lactifluus volemus]